MAEAVTAVRTEVPVLVAFGQLVMFYWQLRLLNRWTNGRRRSCSGRRSERTRGVVSRMGHYFCAAILRPLWHWGWRRFVALLGGALTDDIEPGEPLQPMLLRGPTRPPRSRSATIA